MIDAALWFGFILVSASFILCLVRLLRGPSMPDRIMAADTLYVNGIAMLVLVGISLADSLYFEAALLIAMVGFVGTVAWCKFVTRGTIID
jgi:multicomponent K+:H+ antiporter subunit F